MIGAAGGTKITTALVMVRSFQPYSDKLINKLLFVMFVITSIPFTDYHTYIFVITGYCPEPDAETQHQGFH